MKITERRWREGSGEQYLRDGKTIRCQTRAKHRIRAEREKIRAGLLLGGKSEEEAEEWIQENTFDEDWMWPEFQCTRGEIEGAFACKFHGGMSTGIIKRDITDLAPLDLKHIYDTLRQNPDYLSQKEEITILTARFWSLFEQIKENQSGDATWDDVLLAVEEIASGDVTGGVTLIRSIVHERLAERETYQEISKLGALLSNMRSAEVKNIQTMRNIMTEDQYASSIDTLYRIFEKAVTDEVNEPIIIQRILSAAAKGIREYIGAPMGGSG